MTVDVKKVLPANRPVTDNVADSPAAIAAKSAAAERQVYRPGILTLYLLGITLTLSGTYMSWNLCLSTGFYTYLIMYIVMGLGYVTFCLCLAEVTSALPFAGGAFGLARCTLGFYPAYIIGCCEALEYIASVAFQFICAADMIVKGWPAMASYKPLILLVFYFHTTVNQIIGGATHWISVAVLGAGTFILLLVHDVGVLGSLDLNATVLNDSSLYFTGGLDAALGAFPLLAWCFLGVEAVNLASMDARTPKTQIPPAQVGWVCTMFCTGLFTFITCVGLSTNGGLGEFMTAFAPLDKGFEYVFKTDAGLAALVSAPSQYAGGYSLHWASAKLIHAMGESKLLPDWMGATSKRFGTAHVAIIVASIVGYATCMLVVYYPSVGGYLLPVCLLFAFCSYSGQCVGYISLKMNYPIAKQCKFKNPLGIAGAAYALGVWVIAIISILGFSGHNGIELVFLAATLIVLSIYYVLFAVKRQIMSEEESKVLLVAHIARFNMTRRQRYATSTSGSARATKMSRLSRMLSTKNTKQTTTSTHTVN